MITIGSKKWEEDMERSATSRIPNEIWVGFNKLGLNHKTYRLSRGDNYYNIKYVRQDTGNSETRLTDKDVSAISEMQRKIDVYENYITLLCVMVLKENPNITCLCSDLKLEQAMGPIWKKVKQMILDRNGNG